MQLLERKNETRKIITNNIEANLTLSELEKTWMNQTENKSIFISAYKKINIDKLKKIIFD